jgi:hypothetical protein
MHYVVKAKFSAKFQAKNAIFNCFFSIANCQFSYTFATLKAAMWQLLLI